MKTFKLFFLSAFVLFISNVTFAQLKSETFKVSGNCGMCKSKIESAAKKAGASYALWDEDSKELTVKYESSSSNAAKIQKKIAAAGYDNAGYKAKDKAYNKLHGCCKYDRENGQSSCCDSDKCDDCMKDGKCAPDMSCCKESACAEKDCCKKS
jgi:periplasmic mercuric ion binding protein